jgi:hypothetical protein
MCAQEGLEFLSERKEFWQQQKPVYARRNEALAKKRAIYHMEPKTKSTALVATAMMQFKSTMKPKPSLLAVGDTAFATIELSTTAERRQSCVKEGEASVISNISVNNIKDSVLESNSMNKKAINAEE